MESKEPNDPGNPVHIAIVGTGNGDGGGVAPTPDGTIAKTPAGQPNLKIQVIGPFVAIAVRAAKVFLTAGSATFTTGLVATKGQITTEVFIAAAIAGGLAAGYETVTNLITVFGRLEGKYPILTGSI